MAPLAGGDFFLLVNHEGNKTDKEEGRDRLRKERGREISRFSEVYR